MKHHRPHGPGHAMRKGLGRFYDGLIARGVMTLTQKNFLLGQIAREGDGDWLHARDISAEDRGLRFHVTVVRGKVQRERGCS